jgi:hypothetical protein
MSEEIAKIVKKLEEHEERILKLEKLLFRTKTEVSEKQISIKEFILQKQPKDDIQKALTIGHYLEHLRGFSCFNFRDISDGFREAREKVPPNVPDKIQKNIAKGYMMEASEEKDGLKAYVLTNRGEKFVNDDFKSME